MNDGVPVLELDSRMPVNPGAGQEPNGVGDGRVEILVGNVFDQAVPNVSFDRLTACVVFGVERDRVVKRLADAAGDMETASRSEMNAVLVPPDFKILDRDIVEIADMKSVLPLHHVKAFEAGHIQVSDVVERYVPSKSEKGRVLRPTVFKSAGGNIQVLDFDVFVRFARLGTAIEQNVDVRGRFF